MPQAAIHDFFKQIQIEDSNQSGAIVQSLVADSTTDILTIKSYGGIIFENPNESTDTFGLNVDYSVNVPLGTTALTLTDIISNTTEVNFTGGPGVTVVRNGANELEIGLEEGYTAIKKFAIGADDSTLRFLDDGESALFLGSGGITTSSDIEGNITIDGSAFLQAETNDLTAAVTWANVPDANITQTSVTQHQAALSITESQVSDLGNYIELQDISVGAPAAASGTGSITYEPLTGVFTYTPPDILNSFSVISNSASGNGTLTYNNSIGQFTYTPPDLSSYLTAETNDLTIAVTWANVPDANITQSSVTQHEAALSINESQIAFTSSFIELLDLSVTQLTASGNGTLSYNNANGVFTYTPPDLSSYLTDYTVTEADVTQHEAALGINESQITFTSSFIELIDLSVTQLAASGNGTLSYNNANGVFTYTPPDLSSYLTDYTVTEADVTQHEAALSINESQVTFTSSFIELIDLSVTQLAASGNGTLSYNNANGVFTYTPPDLSSYLTAETDPIVGAVTGLVKSDGAGNISAAVAGTDYLVSETITLATLKAEVAASVDFADFQSRIAAL